MNNQPLLLALLRGLHVAGVLSLFGTLVYAAWVLPAEARAPLRRRLNAWAIAGVAVALAAGCGWLVLQSAAMAGAESWADTAAAVPAVAADTGFGHAMLLRAALLLLALALLRWRPLAAASAGAAVVLQSLMGHAAAAPGAEGWELMGSEALHLLAAGAWLGSLAPLALTVRDAPRAVALAAARRFSPLGVACVAVLAGTAILQASDLLGGLAGLFGTNYGRLALLKLAIFAALLVLAALNRLLWTPAGSIGRLRISLIVETLLGLAVVLAAGALATQPPGIHEQPVWPFASRPSLVMLSDPDLRAEVSGALLMLGGAIVALGLAVAVRRLRWPALAAAAALIWFAVPHFDLLFVEAYPTSFYTSPTGFSADAIAQGVALYPQHCAACHGATGAGDGKQAAKLVIPPADLTAGHLWDHSDGELFWWLTHGMDNPEGGLSMPGFAAVLDEDQRWALIDYIRANNAGMALDRGTAAPPQRAPDTELACHDGRTLSLSDLRGEPVRIEAGAGQAAAPAAPPGQRLITVNLAADGEDAAADCVATDPAAATAYAILAGRPPGMLAGSQFLVDPQGWLRAVWRPGDPAGWTRPEALQAEIVEICTHPVVRTGGENAHHH